MAVIFTLTVSNKNTLDTRSCERFFRKMNGRSVLEKHKTLLGKYYFVEGRVNFRPC